MATMYITISYEYPLPTGHERERESNGPIDYGFLPCFSMRRIAYPPLKESPSHAT